MVHFDGLRGIQKQARKFQKLFAITDSEIVSQSYSDLVLAKLNH